MAFGIKTGKQLAIKASNLRRILPDAKPVLPEADDADVYPHKFADESWSDDSWDERDPKWRAAVKNMFSSSGGSRPAAGSKIRSRGRLSKAG